MKGERSEVLESWEVEVEVEMEMAVGRWRWIWKRRRRRMEEEEGDGDGDGDGEWSAAVENGKNKTFVTFPTMDVGFVHKPVSSK